jgi:hypothetical protein
MVLKSEFAEPIARRRIALSRTLVNPPARSIDTLKWRHRSPNAQSWTLFFYAARECGNHACDGHVIARRGTD